jgi:hypothetical protein
MDPNLRCIGTLRAAPAQPRARALHARSRALAPTQRTTARTNARLPFARTTARARAGTLSRLVALLGDARAVLQSLAPLEKAYYLTYNATVRARAGRALCAACWASAAVPQVCIFDMTRHLVRNAFYDQVRAGPGFEHPHFRSCALGTA